MYDPDEKKKTEAPASEAEKPETEAPLPEGDMDAVSGGFKPFLPIIR